jgi:hypothetical protein
MHLHRTALVTTLLFALLGNGDETAFDRTLTALSIGAAEHDRPGHRLRDAGVALVAIGAKPIETEDLGQRWSKGAKAPAYRDRALGPGYRAISLAKGGTAHFEQTFMAGRKAQVALVPLDQATFQIEVSDDQGARQCAGTGGRCAWTPLWTTRFRIDVANRSDRNGTSYLVVQ